MLSYESVRCHSHVYFLCCMSSLQSVGVLILIIVELLSVGFPRSLDDILFSCRGHLRPSTIARFPSSFAAIPLISPPSLRTSSSLSFLFGRFRSPRSTPPFADVEGGAAPLTSRPRSVTAGRVRDARVRRDAPLPQGRDATAVFGAKTRHAELVQLLLSSSRC